MPQATLAFLLTLGDPAGVDLDRHVAVGKHLQDHAHAFVAFEAFLENAFIAGKYAVADLHRFTGLDVEEGLPAGLSDGGQAFQAVSKQVAELPGHTAIGFQVLSSGVNYVKFLPGQRQPQISV